MVRASCVVSCLMAFSIGVLVTQSAVAAEGQWSQFRGQDGSGHTQQTGIPVRWTASDVTWRTELEGQGHSSVCLWDEQIFLTSAQSTDNGQVERHVVCLNRNDGQVVWQQTASLGAAEQLHKMNSFATPTCACDGQRVVAFFGRGGIHCYDMQGTLLWSRDLGTFPGPWGSAASPIILGDMVIQNCDAAGPSFLVALNKRTGQTIWKTDRGSQPRGGWNTPLLIDTGSRKELIVNGEHGVRGYDPATGRELWFCKSFSGRGTPVPAYADKNLYVISGLPGDIYAVRAGGTGDVTETRMVWHTPRRSGRDVPSPILVDRFLLATNMTGIGTCYDPTDGKTLWQERLVGNFTASPIAVNGLVYLQDEVGETLVIKPDDKLDIIARNSLGDRPHEIFRSTMVPSQGQLFFRSDKAVYCVGKRTK